MKKVFLIIASLVWFSLSGSSQNNIPGNKIDPVFLSLIEQQKPVVKRSLSCKKQKKMKAGNVINSLTEKKYECIIYTKNSKLLRDKNITINSEMPTFVTAVITLQQLRQLSLSPDVTYIEAPKTNTLH